jgi:hypothetical protein
MVPITVIVAPRIELLSVCITVYFRISLAAAG